MYIGCSSILVQSTEERSVQLGRILAIFHELKSGKERGGVYRLFNLPQIRSRVGRRVV